MHTVHTHYFIARIYASASYVSCKIEERIILRMIKTIVPRFTIFIFLRIRNLEKMYY